MVSSEKGTSESSWFWIFSIPFYSISLYPAFVKQNTKLFQSIGKLWNNTHIVIFGGECCRVYYYPWFTSIIVVISEFIKYYYLCYYYCWSSNHHQHWYLYDSDTTEWCGQGVNKHAAICNISQRIFAGIPLFLSFLIFLFSFILNYIILSSLLSYIILSYHIATSLSPYSPSIWYLLESKTNYRSTTNIHILSEGYSPPSPLESIHPPLDYRTDRISIRRRSFKREHPPTDIHQYPGRIYR